MPKRTSNKLKVAIKREQRLLAGSSEHSYFTESKSTTLNLLAVKSKQILIYMYVTDSLHSCTAKIVDLDERSSTKAFQKNAELDETNHTKAFFRNERLWQIYHSCLI